VDFDIAGLQAAARRDDRVAEVRAAVVVYPAGIKHL
jgi:hypothetical protein